LLSDVAVAGHHCEGVVTALLPPAIAAAGAAVGLGDLVSAGAWLRRSLDTYLAVTVPHGAGSAIDALQLGCAPVSPFAAAITLAPASLTASAPSSAAQSLPVPDASSVDLSATGAAAHCRRCRCIRPRSLTATGDCGGVPPICSYTNQ